MRRSILMLALAAAALWSAPALAQARSQLGPLCTTDTTPADQQIVASFSPENTFSAMILLQALICWSAGVVSVVQSGPNCERCCARVCEGVSQINQAAVNVRPVRIERRMKSPFARQLWQMPDIFVATAETDRKSVV